MVLRQVKDIRQVDLFLRKHRRWSSEIVSCLDKPVFDAALWHAVLKGDEIVALSMAIDKLDPVPFFCIADRPFFEMFLKEVCCYQQIHTEISTACKDIFDHYYQCNNVYEMVQMVLEKDKFVEINQDIPTVKLKKEDVCQINALVSPYLNDTIDSSVVENGVFYGVKIEGELVAMAGTHNLALEYKIGTMGFVVTKEDYRRQNLSLACCNSVLSEMFQFCEEVVIKVEEGAVGAISLYKKIGFQKVDKFLEIFADRRIR